MTETFTVSVSRGGEPAQFQSYQVTVPEAATLLDVLAEIQRRQDASLSYRSACRVGQCGTCSITVNGAPRLACQTPARAVAERGTLVLGPLGNLPVIKDLIVDTALLSEKAQAVAGFFEGVEYGREDPSPKIKPGGRARKAADAALGCIECGICDSVCDTVAWDSHYLGPAALTRAAALVNDKRHRNRAEVLERATGDGGCAACHSQGSCTTYCPVGLSPAESIAGLKRYTLMTLLWGGAP